MTAAALPIRSLNHVGRLTKHLDESRAFYRDVLGFREIVRPNFDFPAPGCSTTACRFT